MIPLGLSPPALPHQGRSLASPMGHRVRLAARMLHSAKTEKRGGMGAPCRREWDRAGVGPFEPAWGGLGTPPSEEHSPRGS